MCNVCYGKWKWGHTPSFSFCTPHRACSQLLLVLLLLMRFFIFPTHANTNTQKHTHPYGLYLLRGYWNRPHWSLETEGHPASQPPGLTVPLIDLMKTKGFQSQSQCALRVCTSRVCVWAGPSLYVCVCRLLTTHTVWMNHYHLHIKLLENSPEMGPGPSAVVFL